MPLIIYMVISLCFLFSLLSKTPHFMILAKRSKVGHGIGQICPFLLISLSQLTKSLNCSITLMPTLLLYMNVVQCQRTRSLYYLGTNSSLSCVTSVFLKRLNERLGHSHLSNLKMVPELQL